MISKNKWCQKVNGNTGEYLGSGHLYYSFPHLLFMGRMVHFNWCWIYVHITTFLLYFGKLPTLASLSTALKTFQTFLLIIVSFLSSYSSCFTLFHTLFIFSFFLNGKVCLFIYLSCLLLYAEQKEQKGTKKNSETGRSKSLWNHLLF